MTWTPEKDAKVMRLRAEGHTPQEIAEAVHKTRGAVKFRIHHLSLSAEQRDIRLRADRENRAERAPRKRTTARHHVTQAHSKFVPAEVLAERERRLAAPQPNFGDPPLGFSQLDRRDSAASA